MDILNWIGNHGDVAFWLGIVLIVMTAILCSFFLSLVRSITGKYPPPAVCSCKDDEEEEENAGDEYAT